MPLEPTALEVMERGERSCDPESYGHWLHRLDDEEQRKAVSVKTPRLKRNGCLGWKLVAATILCTLLLGGSWGYALLFMAVVPR